MPNLFHKFLFLIENLNTSFTKISWDEQFDTLFSSYEGTAKDIKAFFDTKENEELLCGTAISFKFVIDKTLTFYDGDFIGSSPYINDEQIIVLTMSINKEVTFINDSNIILFFELDAFISNYRIQNGKFTTVLKRVNHTKPMHIYLPIEETFQNQFVKIIPYKEIESHVGKPFDAKTLKELTRAVENREELTRVESWFPLPHFFAVETKDNQLNKLLNKNLFFVSLMHIANKYKDNKFIIRGQKNLELNYNESFMPENASIIYSIFKFSFSEEQTQDKLEITRNIITIYLHEETIEQLDKQLYKMKQTIERHFSMYVQDKIKKFFDNTKDAIDLAHKYALEAREAADKIATNINTTILALITAVFSGIVILSRGNFLFLVIALGLHIVYFIMSYSFNRHFALKKEIDINYIYDLTSENFSNITPDEKEEIKEKYVTPAINSIRVNLKKYFCLTTGLIIFMVLLIIGTYFTRDLFVNQNENPTLNIRQKQKEEAPKIEVDFNAKEPDVEQFEVVSP